MDGPHRSGPTEPVAGHRPWRPSWGYLVLALVIVAGGLSYAWVSAPTTAPVAATPAA